MKISLKKITNAGLAAVMSIALLAACGTNSSGGSKTAGTTTANTAPGGTINVWSRDSASGTRGAFEEIIDFEGELTADATETSGNGDMAAKVGADAYGIGYVSLTTDFESNNLKKLILDGAEASEENTLSGEYKVSRPFNLVTRAKGDFASEELEQLTAAFVDFLMNSVEGLEAVYSAGGIVDPDSGTPWDELKAKHPIVDQDNSGLTLRTAGSTSVEKTIQTALETFSPMAGNFEIAMNHTGSGAGYKSTLGDEKDATSAAEIGFASRSFKEDGTEDVSPAMVAGTYCMDAIAVVVSKDNPVDELTLDQVAAIFKGEITDWSELN